MHACSRDHIAQTWLSHSWLELLSITSCPIEVEVALILQAAPGISFDIGPGIARRSDSHASR